MSETLSKELFTKLDEYIDSLPEKNGALIPVLHTAQKIFGYLPKEVQTHVSHKLNVPTSRVYGVVTFYALFSMEKKGKCKASVCLGTACYVRGADALIKEFEKELNIKVTETTSDNMFTLESVRCIGACGLAPVVTMNEKVYGKLDSSKIKDIIDDYLGSEGEK